MQSQRRPVAAGVLILVLTGALAHAGQPQDKTSKDKDKDQDKRPRLTLSAKPLIGMSPQKVLLTAELLGGPNDSEDFYCPTIEWDWGDGTQSETTSDCEPYEPGKSSIKRRFTLEHVFRAGQYRVVLRLKKHDKSVTQATVVVEIRPGLRDL